MTLILGIGDSELPWGDTRSLTGADVTRICNEVAEVGATSIRMSAAWGLVDPNNNHKYKWANLDRAIDAAEAAGLDVLLICEPRRLSFWQFLGIPTAVSATASNVKNFGLFCGAIAQRYASRSIIKQYEIGNEVNNKGFFTSPKDPSKYVDFLRAAWDGITAYDPTATVLAGALQAVATDPYLTGNTLHPVEWVTKFYACDPQEWFNGLSMHPYSTDGHWVPLTPDAGNEYAFRNIEAIRAIMDANGDGPGGRDIKIYCTEWGYDSIRSLNNLSTTQTELEAEQAANIATHLRILEGYADDGVIFPTTWLYNYRDNNNDEDPAYSFGTVRYDYTKKPAWTFLHNLTAPWSGVQVDSLGLTDTGSFDIQTPGFPVVDRLGLTDSATFVIPSFKAEFVSAGAGDRDTTTGLETILTWTHVVTDEPNSILATGLVVSTDHLKDYTLYNTLTVTSDLDGPLTWGGGQFISASSLKKGSVHGFGLADADGKLIKPTAGTHNMTAHVKLNNDFVTSLTSVAADSVHIRNVSGFSGQVYAKRSNTGGGTPQVAANSAVDNLVLVIMGASSDMEPTFNQDVRYHAGSTVGGDGDYILIGTAPGANTVNCKTTLLGVQYAAIAFDLVRMGADSSGVGGGSVGSGGGETPPPPPPDETTYDAGLTEPFGYAAEFSGTRRTLTTGANNASVDSRIGITSLCTASANGDEVFLPAINGLPTTYYVRGSSGNGIGMKSGVKLRGETDVDGNPLVTLATGFGKSSVAVIYVPPAATDIIIEDLIIKKVSGSTFDTGIRFGNADLSLTAPNSVTRAIVRNVKIQHHMRVGIAANNPKHLLVESCTISDALALDGNGSGYGVCLDGPSSNNNWIRSNLIGPVIRHGVVIVDKAHHNLIGGKLANGTPCGNEIHHCVSDMIDLHGEDEYSNEISYNLIHDEVLNGTTVSPNGAGIGVGEPPSGTGLGGSTHDKSGPWNFIHHNEVYNCPAGVRVMNKSAHTVIEDNNLHDNDDDILFDQTSGYTLTGVDAPIIKRNTCTRGTNGIMLTDIVTNAVVQGNVVTDNSGHGIYGDSQTTDYTVTGNTVTGNGTNYQFDSTDGTFVP